MLTYEILNSRIDQVLQLDVDERIVKPVEEIAKAHGMDVSVRTTLSSKRGSIHWHFTKGKELGVLEVTYWPKTHQLWVEIHSNRQREWNVAILEPYSQALAAHFGGVAETK